LGARFVIIKNINDNPLSNVWKKRYSSQPIEIQRKLDILDELKPKEYQLNVIKKSKMELKNGDVFLLSPRENIFFYGKVVTAYINHLEKDPFIHLKNLVFIFNCKTNNLEIDSYKQDYQNLLIPPVIVDISYWNKGYFYNVGNVGISNVEENLDYGFYSIGKQNYYKEDGSLLVDRPGILGTYGISTITGVASKIEKELIINSKLLDFN
jgi:hypothetical protein